MPNEIIIKGRIRDKAFLLDALAFNMSWIKKSFSINNNQGSSKYRTSWGKWTNDYPETTGYLLSTLLNTSTLLKDNELKELALSQIKYFESLQLNHGGFKISKDSKKSYVFDSAQIMLGLTALYQNHKDDQLLKMINKCYVWLISLIDDNGEFIDSNFQKNYNPSYYSRIVWSLLKAELLLKTKSEKTTCLYKKILSLLNSNGTFNDCSFDGSPFAFTHNLIYSYRGLWESANLFDDNVQLLRIENHIYSLSQKINSEYIFNGEYDNQWNIRKPFVCMVGNAQLTTLLLLIYKTKKEKSLLKTCEILMSPLFLRQSKFSLFNKGAIPSSIPIWGKYQRFKYTNWTQKFYADAIVELLSIC